MLPNVKEETHLLLADGTPATLRLELASTPILVDPPRLTPVVALPLLPVVTTAPVRDRPAPADTVFDHPAIGGKFTQFILCYGDFTDMHQHCIDSVLNSTARDRLELRIIGNMLCEETRRFVKKKVETGDITVFYDHTSNRRKYPVMREAFRDVEHPIRTQWLIWFDDDTMADTDRSWLDKLAGKIVARDEARLGMIGAKYYWTLTSEQAAWLRAGGWHKGKPFQDRSGKEAHNGRCVWFATGSCWAMKTECIQACDIPDSRLGHNGGDWTIGCQITQNGYHIVHWSELANKKGHKPVINWSSVKRRGLTEPFPS